MQSVDRVGAADYLGLSRSVVSRRIATDQFPKPDANGNGTEWWSLDTLDKYKRALARKKRTPRKRTTTPKV